MVARFPYERGPAGVRRLAEGISWVPWERRERLGNAQSRLFHQRKYFVTEELEIRCEVEEGDLYPVATRALETNQLVHDVRGAADDLDIAAEGAVRLAMSLPGDRVARPLVRDEALDRTVISRI